jgi:hypothetical protein
VCASVLRAPMDAQHRRPKNFENGGIFQKEKK